MNLSIFVAMFTPLARGYTKLGVIYLNCSTVLPGVLTQLTLTLTSAMLLCAIFSKSPYKFYFSVKHFLWSAPRGNTVYNSKVDC